MTNKKIYGIYEVSESFTKDGLWLGYTVKAIESTGKQGKLYKTTDGREQYAAKPKDEELEI
jgi:hypothetical protein